MRWTNHNGILTPNRRHILGGLAALGMTPSAVVAAQSPSIVDDYGAVGDGVTDDRVAFTDAFNDINAGVINRLRIPTLPGASPTAPTKYRISGPLPIIEAQGFRIDGDSMWETQLIRDYNATAGEGFIDIRGPSIGWTLSNLTIASATGRTGGSAVQVMAGATTGYTGGKSLLENLNLTAYGTNCWDYTLWLNGSLKTDAPTGLRTMTLRNVEVFGAVGYSAIISAIVGLSWHGGGCWPASGTGAQSGAILLTGSTAVPSSSVMVSILGCNGLVLSNCHHGVIDCSNIGAIGGVSVSAANTCSNFYVRGPRSGTTSLNWVASSIM
ncbi:hypothetical protein W911_14275 [Hyphomicrobium nitrativorans NL23]|uniref:Pectate lyase superfamily protein domain-containing protein n=1 Tax=Hyphomicrobium nitrativorans NL23 TaxID=1029756 RepID=V5SIG7_9HYPH|nr:hypothetical protein [Hyphomicrobium nitrativorans]AHB50313.1 hypothetical protein W911_14275 [Hyphomicrobium nitrativorans NL23]